MTPNQQSRLETIERDVGLRLPSAYVAFLDSETVSARYGRISAADGNDWDVRRMFELGAGPDFNQLDQTYKLVGDVLPTNAVPIAEDLAGNLFLLDCRTGQVSWWDHERELGDKKTELVARTFEEFLSRIETDD